ncbi:hypothetical protein N665_0655s0002 [Sinapis alba]|nr:hypothetical protein N665_0655s0002 [Sinapis alba]
MGNNAPTQAEINAQFLADNTRLATSLETLTEHLTRLERRDRANGPRPQARNHIYLNDPQSDTDEDNTESESPDQENDQPLSPKARPRPRRRGSLARRKDLKLNPPTFVGKINPNAYIEWERRMEYIFMYYNYSEAKKIALASAQLTDNTLCWWDRDVTTSDV